VKSSDPINTSVLLKSGGYLVSSLSVLLLGVAAWDGASKEPILLACLIGGMSTSILGMLLRWRAFMHNEKKKEEDGQA